MQTHSNDLWQSFCPSSLISATTEQYLAKEIIAFYHQGLINTPRAYEYVTQTLGLHDQKLIESYELGFCDRQFALKLPPTGTQKGEMIRGFFERLKLMNGETGHETYRGMVFVPLYDENEELLGGYGQRVAQFPLAQRGHTLWGLKQGVEGYFYNQAILSTFNHVVLSATPFDVLSFLHSGVNNALGLLDFTYFDDNHLCKLLEHDVCEVTLAFPRTPQGDRYIAHFRRKLQDVDIRVNKLELVVGESVNTLWAQSKRFDVVLRTLKEAQQCQNPFH